MADEEKLVQAAAKVLLHAALDLIQVDPHNWSPRPCESCRAVSAIAGRPFGCYEYQRHITVAKR